MTELVLLGGRVYTMDTAGPEVAEAVAVTDGRVSAVGATADIAALAGPSTRVVRLSGSTVIPGLIDSHCHFEHAGMAGHAVSFAGIRTLDAALDRVAELAADRAPGAWVQGQLWNPVLQLAEGRAPTRQELDRAAAGRPVFLPEGHAASVSTAALRLAGIAPDGHDGRLVEGDVHTIAKVVPEWTSGERARQLSAAMRALNEHGITSVVAGALPPSDVDVLRELAESDASTVRVAAMVTPSGELNPSVTVAEWRDLLAGGPPKPVGDRYLTRGIKLQVDGGMTLGTAATRTPYRTDAGYRGELFVHRARLTDLVDAAHRAGWAVGTHVVGDAAIDLALDVYEATRAGLALPDVLIHASLIQRDQIDRARALGVRVAAQVPFLWRNRDAIAGHLGDERADGAVPLRDLVDGLGPDGVAAGTDYPVNDLDPWQNIHAMATRHDIGGRAVGAAQAITRREAVGLYTTSGAAHTGEWASKGRIAPGLLADLAVLDTDPFAAADPRSTTTLMTVMDGRVVHDTGRLD
ncbi:amidohydrolase [Amycolatopsis sp. EV170708-02-1]|uniref:amidohydrolase n=1 Tax=Amycolatopsis sp. EV170708-02-1 TaxID=2919322 RepID=UPI001F0BB8BE|nr:amidohydrolase [Amycolatopsis sp. EV170708-02-1]UMP06885.1 amidohydrolase [Amycolatopsis sp. EV170708-02-1]